jgi:hypothetical protein
LRATESNPGRQQNSWIASSFALLAMTAAGFTIVIASVSEAIQRIVIPRWSEGPDPEIHTPMVVIDTLMCNPTSKLARFTRVPE